MKRSCSWDKFIGGRKAANADAGGKQPTVPIPKVVAAAGLVTAAVQVRVRVRVGVRVRVRAQVRVRVRAP